MHGGVRPCPQRPRGVGDALGRPGGTGRVVEDRRVLGGDRGRSELRRPFVAVGEVDPALGGVTDRDADGQDVEPVELGAVIGRQIAPTAPLCSTR